MKLRLRPEVAAFAQLMEQKLRENDHKGRKGWKKDKTHRLLVRLLDETRELIDALSMTDRGHVIASHHVRLAADMLQSNYSAYTKDVKGPHEERIGETVDVANFCLMIVDVLGGLKKART